MAESRRFKIPKLPQTKVSFELESPDGEVEAYAFTVPKRAALAMSVSGGGLTSLTGILEWLEAGLSEEGAARLEGRLRDAEDPLDVETLSEVVKFLVEAATATPTDEPSGS